jgi:hypothetical protein
MHLPSLRAAGNRLLQCGSRVATGKPVPAAADGRTREVYKS